MVSKEPGMIEVEMTKTVYNDLLLFAAVLGINVRGKPDISAAIHYLMTSYDLYCKEVGISDYQKFLEAKAARKGK